MGAPHIVPLSTQPVEILRRLQTLTGGGRYLFPSNHDPNGMMSNNDHASSRLNTCIHEGFGMRLSNPPKVPTATTDFYRMRWHCPTRFI
jgi:hypothetical protein